MDLCTFRFFRWSWPWFPTLDGFSFSQSLLLSSGIWVGWLELLLVKSSAKKWLSASAFSITQVTRSLFSFWRGPTFCLVFIFSWHIQRNFSCCPWHHWPDYSFTALAFLAQSVAVHMVFLPSCLSLLQSSLGFFFWVSLSLSKNYFPSMQASWQICPTSSLLGCVSSELWRCDPWILVSFLEPLFRAIS